MKLQRIEHDWVTNTSCAEGTGSEDELSNELPPPCPQKGKQAGLNKLGGMPQLWMGEEATPPNSESLRLQLPEKWARGHLKWSRAGGKVELKKQDRKLLLQIS